MSQILDQEDVSSTSLAWENRSFATSFSQLDQSDRAERLRSVSKVELNRNVENNLMPTYSLPTSSIFNDDYTERIAKITDISPFQWVNLKSVSYDLTEKKTTVGNPTVIYVKQSLFVGTSRGYVIGYNLSQTPIFQFGNEKLGIFQKISALIFS